VEFTRRCRTVSGNKMGLLRSEEMGFYNLVMPYESAWSVLNKIGRLNSLQFIDVSSKSVEPP
jgi:hypothetical protein